MIFMPAMSALFDQIRVYEGVAERTDVRFERSEVRRSAGFCTGLRDLARKVRAAGDGYYYLPVDEWPADTEKIDLLKPWVSSAF